MRNTCHVGCFVAMLAVSFLAHGQNSLSFHHLGNATYQNSNLNPAYIPDGKVFIGLPVLSGVHAHINNKFSYNQLIHKEGDEHVVNVVDIIGDLQSQNMLNAQGNISLMHLGYRFSNGSVVSLFANERFEVDVLYPKSLIELLWKGYTVNTGETMKLGTMGINATHFREIGFGIAHQVKPQLKVGARVKLLLGFLNYSTPGNMVANLKIHPQTYAWDFRAENVVLRSSGVEEYGTNLVSGGGNAGFAIDGGFEYRMSQDWTFSGSITDLGFISWKSDINNVVLNDTTFNYSGINIINVDNIVKASKDSLVAKFSKAENTDAYKTWLPTKAYGSIIHQYTESTHLLGTIGIRYVQGQLKALYGVGLRQKLGPLTASINATRLPQHFFDLGVALAVRKGFVQYYVAADQLLSLSVPNAKAFDFRMGLNFIIDPPTSKESLSRGKTKSGGAKGISTGRFLGKKVKTKRREGIYSIISKQKKRKTPKSLHSLGKMLKKKKASKSIKPRRQTKLPKKKRN